ncbi:hypothetical protein PSET11_03040 [Arthrobacter ulcerisalmonis]|uniref:Terminase-like family protein n=1 Tax=Arthrobacter ulcerisalmonis TaxID=2483813 RepID=A0A3P5XT74_9MICC|nr:hypothetical protein [Arthrobacter ulcerisalmonis]VDC32279.1 hypothetical protein PSET11_03040 [Arthrobacter ulcerisalmonis]
MTAETFIAQPRHNSPIPNSVDLTGAHKAAADMGIELLPQGIQVAELLEAKNEDGTPLYPEAVIQMGRRATKTSSIQATLLARCFNIPGYKIISTAQSGTLSQQFLAELGSQLEMAYPDETTRPFRFYKSNGSIRIVWENGSSWRAVKPMASAVRGMAADCILLDEAGEYDSKVSDDLLSGAIPVLATRPNAQLIITGTPPRTREGLLWQYLTAGRKGTEDLGILDYSMLSTDDASDESVWHRVYPGLSSGLVSIKFLRKALATQGLLSFAREFLCLDPSASSIAAIDPEDWAATQVPDMLPLPTANFSVSFDVAPDGSSSALSVAWYSEQGTPCVQVLAHRAGYSWLPNELAKLLRATRGVPVVYDRIGNNLAVIQELQRLRGVPQSGIESIGAKEVSAGVAILMSALSDRNLIHALDPSLDSGAEGANFRYVNDARLFGRRNSTADVAPLVAASNALYDAAGRKKRSTNRPRGGAY